MMQFITKLVIPNNENFYILTKSIAFKNLKIKLVFLVFIIISSNFYIHIF